MVWLPPPPRDAEGDLRKIKLNAALVAIEAIATALYDPSDRLAVLLGLDVDHAEATRRTFER